MVYSSANGEHYQMYDCNVEIHEDWTKTLRVVDIIYPYGPARGVRIMYELKNYEKLPWGGRRVVQNYHLFY